jgi:hypothetical protein
MMMKPDHRTPDLRALALAVTVLSALAASFLVAQASLVSSAEFAGYGIADTAALAAGGGRR